jgi:hypothetical protein
MAVNPKSLRNLPQYAGKSVAEIERSVADSENMPVAVLQGLTDAAPILEAAEPVAATHLANIAAGRVKVPPHVRAQVCVELLRGRGLLNPKQSQQPQEQSEQFRAAIAAVGRVLELRKRAAEAKDAETIPAA